MAVFCRPPATTAAAEAADFPAIHKPAAETLPLSTYTAAHVRLLDALGRQVRQPAALAPKPILPIAALPPRLYTAQWLAAGGRVLLSRKVAHP